MTDAWTEHGPLAVLRRHRPHIETIMQVVRDIWDTWQNPVGGTSSFRIDAGLHERIKDIRKRCGIDIDACQDVVVLRNGITAILRQESGRSTTITSMKRQASRIERAFERKRLGLDSLRGTLDGISLPASAKQWERTAYEMADAIDRHEARIRHALPSLRNSASYTMLVDPFVVAAQTRGMEDGSPRERAEAFVHAIRTWNPSSDTLPFEGARRIGNVIISHMGSHLEHEGRIFIEHPLPETHLVSMKGKPLEKLVGNHPASGMGIRITSITRTDGGGLIIGTSAEKGSSLIPMDIYSARR